MPLQSLLLSAQYTPSFQEAAFPKSLLQTCPTLPPQRKFPQGKAKVTDALFYTKLPWLRLLSLLPRKDHCAKLLKLVLNACRRNQLCLSTLQVKESDPLLAQPLSFLH